MVQSKDAIKCVSESGNFSSPAVEVSQIAHLRLTVASTYQDAAVPYNKPVPATLSLSLNENN